MQEKPIPTTEEIIATLSRTSLPTVIIEGSDDVIVYRRLEDIFSDIGLSVMPVGGRNNVLKIFDRLNEIKIKTKIAFIADKDMWVLTKIPENYVSDNFIFTEGYSIENDIIRDSEIENILDGFEKQNLLKDISKYNHWYSIVLNRAIQGDDPAELCVFAGKILDDDVYFSKETHLREGELYPDEIKATVNSDYLKYIRGKSLMQILTRQLSRKGRNPRINPQTLLGIAPAKPGENLNRIFSGIGKIFEEKLN